MVCQSAADPARTRLKALGEGRFSVDADPGRAKLVYELLSPADLDAQQRLKPFSSSAVDEVVWVLRKEVIVAVQIAGIKMFSIHFVALPKLAEYLPDRKSVV